MIFADANVFLRYFVQAQTVQDRQMARQAKALFARAESGEAQITTSEAVVAEVAFILTSPRHYGLAKRDAGSRISNTLLFTRCRLPDRGACLRALTLWAVHAKLGFPDALGAAYSELRDHDLATFDRRLSRLTGIRLHGW